MYNLVSWWPLCGLEMCSNLCTLSFLNLEHLLHPVLFYTELLFFFYFNNNKKSTCTLVMKDAVRFGVNTEGLLLCKVDFFFHLLFEF